MKGFVDLKKTPLEVVEENGDVCHHPISERYVW